MTNEEIEYTCWCADQGLDAEDIFERLNEEVPIEHIMQVLNDYDDALMGGGCMEEFY